MTGGPADARPDTGAGAPALGTWPNGAPATHARACPCATREQRAAMPRAYAYGVSIHCPTHNGDGGVAQ